MTMYDITIPMRPGMAVWPGDSPFQFELGWNMDNGASVNVGQVSMSVHTGTHIDAPFHFDPSGTRAGDLDLTVYMGSAVVVEVAGQWEIGRDAFQHVDFSAASRLLIRTLTWTDHNHFPERVPVLAPDVPAWLGEQGVVLFGIDVPSVDAIDSEDLPIHHALDRANIRILESIDLRHVPPGVYRLSALPLRLVGADGSPVRAVLWK